LKLFLILVGLCGPFLLWIAIFSATKLSVFDLHSMLRVVKVLRWLSYATGAMLWLCHYSPLHLSWGYGWAAVMFSLGLSFPEFWLKSCLLNTQTSVVPR